MQTTGKTNEVPRYVVRIRRKGSADLFYRDHPEFILTEASAEATLLTESGARVALARLYATSYYLTAGAAHVIPAAEADAPDKMKIRFHIAGGKDFEQGKKIKDIIFVILEKEFPNADISASHWDFAVRTFCHVSNAPSPMEGRLIEQRINEIIADIIKKVTERKMEEVFA